MMMTNLQPGQPGTRDQAVSGATKPTTAHRKRTTPNSTLLQISLVTGSVLATILGANLLASSDANAVITETANTNMQIESSGVTTVPATVNTTSTPVSMPTVFVPSVAPATAAAVATPTLAIATIADTSVQLELEPAPEPVVPNLPVAIEERNSTLVELSPTVSPALPTVQPLTQASIQQPAQVAAPVSRSRSSR